MQFFCIAVIAQTIKHIAIISGVFKRSGSAKAVFSSLLFLQLCRTNDFCFWQFVY